MELPKIKNKKCSDPAKLCWLVYGPPKIGKSSLCSQFDDPLFIATEDRLKFLDVYKLPTEGAVRSWQELGSIFQLVDQSIKNGSFKFKTVVIDTLDNIIPLLHDHVCKELSVKTPGEAPHGQGWGAINKTFSKFINSWLSLGIGVVFICHSEEKVVETSKMRSNKIVPNIGGKPRQILNAAADVIAYVDIDPETEIRTVFTERTELFEAGDGSDKLPGKFELNKGYKFVKECFKKGDK
tara:strand:+ start:1567 stop:2280 length:714 start_codon:yes stop_codon:yes gene_type:complete